MKAGKAAKTTQAIEKEAQKKEHATDEVNTHLMDLCQFNEDEKGDERDGTS